MTNPQKQNMIITTIAKQLDHEFTLTNENEGICFDTSNHRLGINTFNPEYALDINGSGVNGSARISNKLIVGNIEFDDISSNVLILSKDFSTNSSSSINTFIKPINFFPQTFSLADNI